MPCGRGLGLYPLIPPNRKKPVGERVVGSTEGGNDKTSKGIEKGMEPVDTFVSYASTDLLISNSNSQSSDRCEVENERSWETKTHQGLPSDRDT